MCLPFLVSGLSYVELGWSKFQTYFLQGNDDTNLSMEFKNTFELDLVDGSSININ